ncbi:hypothetical protein [Streptomyces sp. DSM 15324]|uniref:hypothetical protein n=1 Tax=Streptomyces sp. DSM 15324 TaxID=1739111 RepID=UPI00074A6C19|nr:hypothetical protein [Streptomyces sp. DSM 15324]KUO07009.1 hypothetical protein AQJ58_37840 [Streptomyces sp. DSM 15324]
MGSVRARAATGSAIALAVVSGSVPVAVAADTGGARADIRADVNRDGRSMSPGDSDGAGGPGAGAGTD